MCIRDSVELALDRGYAGCALIVHELGTGESSRTVSDHYACLLYTSDAADERSSVDLGGRRIIKKKKYTS